MHTTASIPTTPRRPTTAVVDLAAYRANLAWIRSKLPAGVGLMPVVKADAYGHGIIDIARAAVAFGVEALAVATVDEALELRETDGFQEVPILVASPSFPQDAEVLQRARVSVCIGTRDLLRRHLAVAHKIGRAPKLHIKLDTGMGRCGFDAGDLSALSELADAPEAFEGLMTHFSVSDSPRPDDFDYTILQRQRFERAAKAVWKAGFRPFFHAANSGAVLNHDAACYDLVRPGIITYGANPDPAIATGAPLRPVMSLRTRIAAIHDRPRGASIGYGRTRVLDADSRIGLLPIGYGDGFPRCLGERGGEVLVRGRRAPIAGRICMDQVMVDLTGIPDAAPGDEVVLIGAQGEARITLEEIALKGGTIPYEITCHLSRRIPRIAIDSEPAAAAPGAAWSAEDAAVPSASPLPASA